MKGVQTVFSFEILFLYYVAILLAAAVPRADAFLYGPATTSTPQTRTPLPLRKKRKLEKRIFIYPRKSKTRDICRLQIGVAEHVRRSDGLIYWSMTKDICCGLSLILVLNCINSWSIVMFLSMAQIQSWFHRHFAAFYSRVLLCLQEREQAVASLVDLWESWSRSCQVLIERYLFYVFKRYAQPWGRTKSKIRLRERITL